MGWFTLAILAAAAGAALWLIGVPRTLASFVAAGLMLGGAGYALQGRPMLAASPVAAQVQAIEVDPGMVQYRTAILNPENPAAFAAADAALRRGDPGAGVEAMLAAVRANPRDATAWTGLGSAYAAHDMRQMSPAAKFAFARAVALAPRTPGPYFFLGMAAAGAGDLRAAKTAWEVALTQVPRGSPLREDIAMRVRLVDTMMRDPQALEMLRGGR